MESSVQSCGIFNREGAHCELEVLMILICLRAKHVPIVCWVLQDRVTRKVCADRAHTLLAPQMSTRTLQLFTLLVKEWLCHCELVCSFTTSSLVPLIVAAVGHICSPVAPEDLS